MQPTTVGTPKKKATNFASQLSHGDGLGSPESGKPPGCTMDASRATLPTTSTPPTSPMPAPAATPEARSFTVTPFTRRRGTVATAPAPGPRGDAGAAFLHRRALHQAEGNGRYVARTGAKPDRGGVHRRDTR